MSNGKMPDLNALMRQNRELERLQQEAWKNAREAGQTMSNTLALLAQDERLDPETRANAQAQITKWDEAQKEMSKLVGSGPPIPGM